MIRMPGVRFLDANPEAYLKECWGMERQGAGKVYCVFPDVVAVSEARDILLESFDAVDMSFMLTIEDLASLLIRRKCGEVPVLIPEGVKKLVAKHVLHDVWEEGSAASEIFYTRFLDEYENIQPLRGRSGEWLAELLKTAGADLDTESQVIKTRIIEKFSDMYEEKLAELEDNGMYCRYGLIRKASVCTGALLPSEMQIAFFFLNFADSVLMEFIRALSGVADVTIVTDGPMRQSGSFILTAGVKIGWTLGRPSRSGAAALESSDEEESTLVDFFGAPDRRREITEVARRIRMELSAGGCRESDFAVLSGNVKDYDSTVREIFERYGLRVERGGRRRLQDTSIFAMLKGFIRCLEPDAERDEAMQFIAAFPSGACRLNRDEENALYRMPLKLSDWETSMLDRDSNDSPALTGAIRLIHRIIEGRRFASAPHGIDEWTAFCESLLQDLEAEKTDANDREKLVTGMRSLLLFGDSLKRVLHVEKISFTDYSRLIEDIGYFESGSRADDRAAVLLTDLGIVYFRRTKHTFIVGVNEGVFPAKPVQGIFLNRNILDRLQKSGVATRRCTEVVFADQRYHYYRVRNLADRITLSFISDENGMEGGLPSEILLNEARRKEGDENVLERVLADSIPHGRFFPENGEMVAGSEVETALAYLIGRNRDVIRQKDFIDIWKKVSCLDAETFVQRLERYISSPLEWNFSPPLISSLVSARTLSPSDLAEYCKCPFRFVLTRLLKVQPVYRDFDAISKGSHLHEILRRLFSPGSLEKLRRMSRDEINSLVDIAVIEYFSERFGSHYNTDPVTTINIDNIANILKEFVAREAELHLPLGRSIALLEHSFGGEGDEFTIDGFRFTGRIDRVDLLPGSATDAVVFDYKSVRPSSLSKYFSANTADQQDFGIPIYSIYLRDRVGYRINGGIYYSIFKSRKEPDMAGVALSESVREIVPGDLSSSGKRLKLLGREEMEIWLDKYRKEVVSIASKIQKCIFPVKPLRDECSRCTYRSVCRNWNG